MFYILLTLMLISGITGGIFLFEANLLIGGIFIGVALLLFFILITYYKKKLKKMDCTPDCSFFDCDGPDCGW